MTAASHKQSNLYVKKGRRGAQTTHSNSMHFVAPDLYSASAIHLPFSSCESASPRSDDRRDSSVASRREVFLTSSVGQQQNFRGVHPKPLAGKLAALNARC